jgi:hypothetical protein
MQDHVRPSTTRHLFAVLLLLLCNVQPLLAADRDVEFTTGLRRLQLFDLAEKYCRRELNQQSLSPEREATLTLELIRTLALQALSRPAADREPLWKTAHGEAAEFFRTRAAHPRAALVRLQDALTLLAEGEVAQQEAETTADATLTKAASDKLRTASRAFDALRESLDKEIIARRGKPVPEGGLTVDELPRLQANTQLYLAKANQLQALCYPADSRDRKALLLATLTALETSASRLDADDELAGRIRVMQLAVHRELGQMSEAQRLWPLAMRDALPLEIQRQAIAEAARLLIAAERPDKALALLDDPKYLTLTQVADAELDLARLEAILALARSEKNAAEGAKRQREAASLAQRIDARHGRAVGRRADQLVAALLPQDSATADVELLARLADNLYVKRQWDDALTAYDKAAAAAATAGQSNREFELRYKAALVAQEQRAYGTASSRFERLAIEHKQHPQAAEAHLLACWNKAQQVRTSDAEAESYLQLLGDHVARWPNAPSADKAYLWLGSWQQAHARWLAAFEAYAQVRSTSPDSPQAIEAATACARQLFAGRVEEATAERVVAHFESVAAERDEAGKSTPVARSAALSAAELALAQLPDGAAHAEKLLRTMLADKAIATDDEAWRRDATSLLLAAIAGQPARRNEAEKLLESLAEQPDQLLPLLDRLSAMARQLDERSRRELATLQLAVVDRLLAAKLKFSAAQQEQLSLARAASLRLLDRRDDAIKAYAALAEAHPHSAAVQEAYAELLTAADDEASRKLALNRWRQIAQRAPPRSELWHRAKFEVASLQARLGDTRGAATLCRFLLETPPGIESEAWRKRFEQLLAEQSSRR